MKFLLTNIAAFSLMQLCFALPPGTDEFSSLDALAFEGRAPAPRHCGTFRFKCKNAAGACNNACYFINCVNKGNRKFTWGPSPGIDNRVESGCTTSASATICRLTPLSPRFWDRQGDDIAPKPLQCDEFPMNAFKQAAFKPGEVRNSLRCINGPQNGSGGSQFGQFVRGEGDWKKGGALAGTRTCDGKMNDGDTFEVDWIIDGDNGVKDQNKLVPYCKSNPSCINDGYQFHMTKLQKSGKSGSFSQPYNYNTNNHYAITGKSDIMQYRVKIFRIGDDKFEGEVFQVNGKDEVSRGKATGTLKSGDKGLEIKGLPKSLYVFSRGKIGTEVNFNYTKSGSTFFTFDWAGGDFAWTTTDKGIAGAYCKVGSVNQKGNPEQHIECDFPGLA